MIEKIYLREKKRAFMNTQEKWVSATEIKNYLVNDPLLDWLDFNADLLDPSAKVLKSAVDFNKKSIKKSESIRETSLNTSAGFLFSQGRNFESEVIKKLSSEHDVANVDAGNATFEFFDQTIQFMVSGREIIYCGVLIDTETRTFGIPDLLVRSDVAKDLFDYDIEHGSKFSNKWHYVVYDIKNSSIAIKSNGRGIINTGLIPSYKGQLYIYNQILSKIQGYTPLYAFLIGRSWKINTLGTSLGGNNALESIGPIDFYGSDSDIAEKVKLAIEWRRLASSPDAREWNITSPPLSREELYPNSNNKFSYPWTNIKKTLSERNKEITSLYKVKQKHRNNALKNGIYSWDNNKCTIDTLNVTGEQTRKLVSNILETNHQSDSLVLPSKLKTNLFTDDIDDYIEFFIDFEVYNECFSKIDSVIAKNNSYIYMIGIGYYFDGKWNYKNFISDSMDNTGEEKICLSFCEFVNKTCKILRLKPRFVHWSPAEVRWWNKVCNKYPSLSCEWNNWIDLLKIFTDESITVIGALDFKLKSVAAALSSHGLIESNWEGIGVGDGIQATLLASGIYYNNIGVPPSQHPQMKSVADYNMIDVLVLKEIIDYLRVHHLV